MTDDQWSNLPALIKTVLVDRDKIRRKAVGLSEDIRASLGRAQFAEADLVAHRNPLSIGNAAYTRARQAAVNEAMRKIERAKKQKKIEKLEKEERKRKRAKQKQLEKEAAEEARREEEERERARREEARRVEREKLAAPIREALDPVLRQSVIEADRLNGQINKDGVLDYAAYKSEYLMGWLSERFSRRYQKMSRLLR